MQPQLSETFSFVQHVDPKSAIYCHSGSSLMPGCSCDEAVAAVRRLDATTALPSTAPGKPLVAQGKIGGTNPWTGEALPEVNVSSIRDVHKAVDAARTAQRFWKDLSLKQRARFMKEAAKRLLARREQGLTLVSQELGKVPADALFTEALGPLDALAGWLRVIDGAPAGEVSLNPLAFPSKQARIDLIPRGVVGIIAPWNFPIAGLYRSVFPALLLGNAVVVKPSEHSPRSSAWFLSQLTQALPPGLVQVVQGDGATGRDLLHAGIDACVFTGSSSVGETVERTCFARGIPCSAEMGGNDAAIVLADAELGRTVAAITHWALQNAGQACGAVKVVYVERAIAQDFTKQLAQAWRQFLHTSTDQPSGTLAPLAFDAQRDVLVERIEQAKLKGAQVLVGGTVSGLSVTPTLLTHCNSDMDIVREETFGPVLPIVVVDDAEEAVRRVNQSDYGLTASIWTRQVARAEQLVSQLDVGVVTVNNHALTGAIVDLPWSGRRRSGRGIANSAWSLSTFVRPKAILLDRSTSVESYWMPFDDNLEELGESLADAQLGRWGRVPAVPFLIKKRISTIKTFFEID